MSNVPKGIRAVAVLTLSAAIGLFFFSSVLTALGAMGHAGQPIDPSAMLRFYTLIVPPLVLSVFSVVASIGIFTRSRSGWYFCILLWVFSITYFVYVAFSLLPISAPLANVEYILVACVILVNIAFIAYFQSVKVKRYFKISGQRTQP